MIRRNLTPSLLISLLALFVATSGASYAALQIPKQSVGTPQLKTDAVGTKKIKAAAITTKKLRTDSVGTKKVKDGSLLASDFAPGELPGQTYRYEREGGLLSLDYAAGAIFSTESLPAGSYIIMSRVNLVNTSANRGSVICSIANDAAQNITVLAGDAVAIAQTATVTLEEDGKVDLNCWINGTTTAAVSAAQTTITALQVSDIK